MIVESISLLSIIHLIFTSFMVGVIWIVQLVHYPSFHYIDFKKYRSFQRFHMEKISFIVVPAMIFELGSGLMLFFFDYKEDWFFILSMVFLLVIWIITAIFFSKLHGKLANGYVNTVVDSLIKINWFRTLLWTVRLFLVLYSVY